MSKQINVMIMGSNPVACELYKTVIDDQPGFDCKHVFHSCDQLFADIPDSAPDVMLVDFTELQEMTGACGCIYEIRQTGFDGPILVVTALEDDEVLFNAIRTGATGFLVKGFAAHELILAIREAFERKATMSPALARRIMQALERTSVLPRTGPERDILQSLSHGDTIREIATLHAISRNAISKYIYHIYTKISHASAQNPLDSHPKHANFQHNAESKIQNH